MKVTKAQAAENRERILRTAARLFRGKGFDGVGVAELMQGAGLTNGAFYGHFESKDDLIAQVCGLPDDNEQNPWNGLAESPTPVGLSRFVRAYLSPEHVRARSGGCPVGALSGDVARQIGPAQHNFTKALQSRLEALAAAMPGPPARQREQALSTVAALVGALVLARAVDDPALAAAILDNTAQDLQLRGRA
jgi:TetR/AcrR family transcriptional repressor of nem operon